MEASLDNIISECKRFNKFAQKLLYEKYAPVMYGICLRYLNDSSTAKDIVQEGFIKVFSKLKQYSSNGSFDGWIKRIFINTVISHTRKQNKNKVVNFEDIEDSLLLEEDKFFDGDCVESSQGDSQIILSNDFSVIELLKVLENLPDKYRIVFNLYCLENLNHEDIAEMLNIDVSTSRTRLSRARKLIQKELYKCIH